MLLPFHIVFNPIFLDVVHSTNDYALDLLAKSNPIEGTVISTHNQTKGKGQIGRTWFSGEYKNLSFSLVLTPHFLPIQDSFYLSMILALAISDEVRARTRSEDVTIKWPNDIYVGDKKIAGLLLQQNVQGKKISTCILGVGLNVNQIEFPEFLPNPVSLYNIIRTIFDLQEIESSILERIGQYYLKLRNREFSGIKQLYLKNLYRRGETSKFTFADDKVIEAEILGIDEIGKLVLQINGALEKFSLHELKMII